MGLHFSKGRENTVPVRFFPSISIVASGAGRFSLYDENTYCPLFSVNARTAVSPFFFFLSIHAQWHSSS
jgi:hypothetical protein